MPEPQAFDVVVIGAGPAGVTAAITAARLGKSVAVVEKNPAVGGAALNTGTVPSKTLRETALALSGLRTRNLYGVDLSFRRECTVADLLRHERAVRDTEQARWAGLLGQYGVIIGPGAAAIRRCPHVRRKRRGRASALVSGRTSSSPSDRARSARRFSRSSIPASTIQTRSSTWKTCRSRSRSSGPA